MRNVLAGAVLLTLHPTWALYKCVSAGGSTSFQNTSCVRSQAQTTINSLVEAPKPGVSPAAEAAPGRRSI